MADRREGLRERIETLEESYEFFLAYAAQGATSDKTAGSGTQLRTFLDRAADALAGLGDEVRALAREEGLEPADVWQDFAAVLERDAGAAAAAVRLVAARSSISSQLVDNLNANVHLRALLTDLFLLDDLLA